VDYNHLQGFGRDVISQQNIGTRFADFGFKVHEVNGNEIQELIPILQDHDGPLAIIAHTVKGRGVSLMEDKLEWHYKSPNDEQLNLALKELK
jgi:transketolase